MITVTPIVCPGVRCSHCSQVAQAELLPVAVVELRDDESGKATAWCAYHAGLLLWRLRAELAGGQAAAIADGNKRNDGYAAPLSSGSAERVAS